MKNYLLTFAIVFVGIHSHAQSFGPIGDDGCYEFKELNRTLCFDGTANEFGSFTHGVFDAENHSILACGRLSAMKGDYQINAVETAGENFSISVEGNIIVFILAGDPAMQFEDSRAQSSGLAILTEVYGTSTPYTTNRLPDPIDGLLSHLKRYTKLTLNLSKGFLTQMAKSHSCRDPLTMQKMAQISE